QGVALLVQVREVLLLEGDALDLVLGAEAFVQLIAGLEVLGLDVGESPALAGLDVAGLGDDPQAAVVLQDHAGLDGVAVDFHWSAVRERRSKFGRDPYRGGSRSARRRAAQPMNGRARSA